VIHWYLVVIFFPTETGKKNQINRQPIIFSSKHHSVRASSTNQSNLNLKRKPNQHPYLIPWGGTEKFGVERAKEGEKAGWLAVAPVGRAECGGRAGRRRATRLGFHRFELSALSELSHFSNDRISLLTSHCSHFSEVRNQNIRLSVF
jgi:hypothetical protein